MTMRHFLITSSGGFDGTTLAPASGWDPVIAGMSQNSGYQSISVAGPVGRFSREVLGISPNQHSLVRVVYFGTPLSTYFWRSDSSSLAIEGTPINTSRETARALSTDPAEVQPMELFPRDELLVSTVGPAGNVRGTIAITVNDLSEGEYHQWCMTKALAAANCCVEPTIAEFSVTETGVLPAPTADLNFYNIALDAPAGVIRLPSVSTVRARQVLHINNIGAAANTALLEASAGDTVNGIAFGTTWMTLTSPLGVIIRKQNATAWFAAQGLI